MTCLLATRNGLGWVGHIDSRLDSGAAVTSVKREIGEITTLNKSVLVHRYTVADIPGWVDLRGGAFE
jgi:hypothetical protein